MPIVLGKEWPLELDPHDRVLFTPEEESRYSAPLVVRPRTVRQMAGVLAQRFGFGGSSARPPRWVIYTGRHEDPRRALERLRELLPHVHNAGEMAFCVENLELIMDQLAGCKIQQVL